ncbi:NERD domain-containing protein, partial [Pseudomonas aeruginosa]
MRDALGLAISDPSPALHTWVVDTSIELDGEVVDGALVVSREVLEVALRDEQHYLRAFDQDAEEEEAIATLYPDGF